MKSPFEIQEKYELSEAEQERIHQIWNREYPVAFQRKTLTDSIAFTEKCTEPKHLVIYNEKKNLIAWLFLFQREGQRWFSILVDAAYQQFGLGTKLLKHAQATESELNGWVIDHDNDLEESGKNYRSPIPFYLKNGFQVLTNTRWDTDSFQTVKIQWKQNH